MWRIAVRNKLPMKLGLVLSATLMLAGCQTTSLRDVKSTCNVFGPLSWHELDTKLTKRGIMGHNAAGKRVCGWKPRK
jgi:hypothetical protein